MLFDPNARRAGPCWLGLVLLLTGVARAQEPVAVVAKRNLPYAGTDNPRQQLDLYLPAERRAERLPVVVWIHGGGWRVGGKGDGRQVKPLVESGRYAGVSIGYRLTDEASWPAQIHDCKAAIRWVRANADRYGLDPERIGVFGSSAGGHLSAMLGTTEGHPTLEGELGPHVGVSSRVRCVVDFFGPTELLTMGTWHDNPGSPESKLVGGTLQEMREVAIEASPLSHVSDRATPFLIIHGTADAVVPFEQSVKFHAALEAAGVESALHEMPEAGHGEPQLSGAFDAEMREFFDRHLQGRADG